MAIIIPSKNIYQKDNDKVRDNIIDRIEVRAVEVKPNNEYDTPVYNEDLDFSIFETTENTITNYQDVLALNQGGSTSRNVRGACGLKYELRYIETPNILIPKVKENKFISKIYDGKDDEGNPRIKLGLRIKQTNYKGEASYQPSSNSFDFQNATLTKEETEKENIFYGFENFGYKNDISSIVSSLYVSSVSSLSANHSIIEENNKLKISSYLNANSNNNWASSIIIDNYISANLLEPDIVVTSETLNNIEYYKLSSTKVLIGIDTTFASCLIEDPNDFSNVSGYYRAVATRVLQECQQISLTVYGNTIGISLTDKTIYFPDGSGTKPFSIEGNELMQTSNYSASFIVEKEFDTPISNSDFTFVNSAPSDTASATSYLIFAPKYKITSVDDIDAIGINGDQYVRYEILSNGSLKVYLNQDGGNIEWLYLKITATYVDGYDTVLAEYLNGKETATILCDINDYFDDYGNQKIFKNGISQVPISFSWDGFISANPAWGYYRSYITLTQGDVKAGEIVKTKSGYIEFESDGNVTERCWCKIYGDTSEAETIFKKGSLTITRSEKMVFEMYDEVIPMVYGANGVDKPISKLKNGNPKKFKVLGTRIFYDGAVWQELTLQESL